MNKLFLSLCLFVSAASAQPWLWTKKVPYQHEVLVRSAMDSFGHMYLLTKNVNQVIYKLDTNGAVIGQHIFPDRLSIRDLEINSQDQLIVCGGFTDTLQLGNNQWISSGLNDVFLGAFTQNFQLIWGESFGGAGEDCGFGLAIDSHDNNFICGLVSGTLNFGGYPLNCLASGNTFVARFNLAGTLAWVTADNSDETPGYSYSYGTRIFINKNDGLLVTGNLDYKNYFTMNGFSLTIPPLNPEGYNYGYCYGLKMDVNKTIAWGTCIKRPKFVSNQFAGLTSDRFFMIDLNGFNGDYGATINTFDGNGNFFNKMEGSSIYPDRNYATYLGTIDDQVYFLCSALYYDQYGEHRPNYIFRVTNSGFEILRTFSGDVGFCTLLKTTSNEYYLTGVFNKSLIIGNDTLTTNLSSGYTDYYESRPFVAKLGGSLLTTGLNSQMPDLLQMQVYPNPSSGSVHLSLHSPVTEPVALKVFNAQGQLVLKNEEFFSPTTGFTIDLGNQQKGLYVVEMTTSTKRVVQKIVVE
jgi:hypothetical protein